MKAELVKREDRWDLYNEHCHKIASTLDGAGNKLSLKNCQAIERGYDLDELAYSSFPNGTYETSEIDLGLDMYKLGFQKALEMMGDKKFSEEDVMLGWDAGVMSQSICFTNYFGLKRESELKSHRESYQGNLKPSALQQTEWEVTFNPDELDADGCLILKPYNLREQKIIDIMRADEKSGLYKSE